ncbi:MAG: hypothetical protein P4L84_02900 [Isosphaeraceae bacterium]|nr:hypothetical protein [Isosphaeraceae bacterium]
MRFRHWARQRGARGLGDIGLIFSLVHTPLPQADYHNIRHHDGPGELCAYHDHLLRWHPQATAAEDVAVLHWHWFLPQSERPEAPAGGEGPAWHAHVADWDASQWDAGPPRLSPPSVRFAERPAPSPIKALAPDLADALNPPRLASHPPQAFSATFAPRVSLASLLQRWAC